MPQTVIVLHAAAPPKPERGEPCNGCGVCCAAEPCPIGQIVSRRRSGACRALLWDGAERRYRCGLLAAPKQFLPGWLHRAAPLLARIARRYIAAGIGCDASYVIETDPQDFPGRPPAVQR